MDSGGPVAGLEDADPDHPGVGLRGRPAVHLSHGLDSPGGVQGGLDQHGQPCMVLWPDPPGHDALDGGLGGGSEEESAHAGRGAGYGIGRGGDKG